jgi:hypothetical protein
MTFFGIYGRYSELAAMGAAGRLGVLLSLWCFVFVGFSVFV